ncbi:MAG: hypothetical protein M3Q42_10105 [Pseudomonadota bacterium]|nr:hypothetical protein [Pseudomonadota bacterium]
MNRVLIVTISADIHADMVESKMATRGARPFRVNLDEFPRDFSVDLRISRNGLTCALTHLPSGDRISLEEIRAVWSRKPSRFCFVDNDLGAQEEAFAQSETEHSFFSLLYALDCFWMSHPLATRSALWKGEQLNRAAGMGFLVPRSIITNCPDAVRSFVGEVNDDVIFKAMSSASLCAEEVSDADRRFDGLPTTVMTSAHLEALDAVRQSPCLFQEHIAKKHELRVTVIGHQAFAARICSQSDSRTRVDFRNFAVEIPYMYERLAPDVEARCIGFVRSYGLEFGALDLIVTPDDDIVFLENNPAGQFLFVEQLVPELRMLDAVTDLLMSKAEADGR